MQVCELPLQQRSVLLRYPVVVWHEVAPGSPIEAWATADGLAKVGRAHGVCVWGGGA